MKVVYPALLLPIVMLAILLGCGGGGGGSNNNSTGSALQAYYQVVTGISSTTAPQLAPGDQVTLTATYTSGGSTVTLSPYNFVVQGGSTIGTVTTGGLLTVGSGAVAGTTYTITASSSAGTVTWTFVAITPLTQPAVVGIVESDATNGGIANVAISGYDTGGNQVGTATTAADGTFTMSVPATALKFGISLAGVDQSVNTFYSIYNYGSGSYDSATPQCYPTLPTLTTGNHRYALSYVIYLNAHLYNGYTYPPPAPPGCF